MVTSSKQSLSPLLGMERYHVEAPIVLYRSHRAHLMRFFNRFFKIQIWRWNFFRL
jgi:hypothetical protein